MVCRNLHSFASHASLATSPSSHHICFCTLPFSSSSSFLNFLFAKNSQIQHKFQNHHHQTPQSLNTLRATVTHPQHHVPPRFDTPGPRLVATLFASPAFVAVASSSRQDAVEIFLFASLNPKPLVLRDARVVGRVAAFTLDAAGRTHSLHRPHFTTV